MSAPKILIVDDDEESRSLLREVLGSSGFSADAVPDGAQAREVLGRDPAFRIVILDLRMPAESGLDILRDLRHQDSKYSVVLMSSFFSGEERKMAHQLGAEALLEKPFRLNEFVQVVTDLAGKKSLEVSP